MAIKATTEQQLSHDVILLLNAVAEGYKYDPGDSDLDNEQPISVRITLGDYRRAVRLRHELGGNI